MRIDGAAVLYPILGMLEGPQKRVDSPLAVGVTANEDSSDGKACRAAPALPPLDKYTPQVYTYGDAESN